MRNTTSILIVENEGLIALDLQATLEGLGYTVPFIADNSTGALEAVERFRPSLPKAIPSSCSSASPMGARNNSPSFTNSSPSAVPIPASPPK